MHITRHNNSIGRRNYIHGITAIFVLTGIMILVGMPIIDFFSRGAETTVSSTLSGISAVEKIVSLYTPFIANEKKLLKENSELSARLGEANARLWTARLLETENRELKTLLGRDKSQQKRVVGAILIPYSNNPYGTFIIDIGEYEEASVGDIVFAFNDIAVGEITYVYNHHSTAILFSAPEKITSARLEISQTPVELVGRGGGDFEIRLPKGVVVAKEELVVSGGIDKIILGAVKEIYSDSADTLQSVLVSVPINIHTLDKVFIEVIDITR